MPGRKLSARLCPAQTHATPFLYSHLEITSRDKASVVAATLQADPDLGDHVRSVSLSASLDGKDSDEIDEISGDHLYSTLLRCLNGLKHVAFGPIPVPSHLRLLAHLSYLDLELHGLHFSQVSPRLFPSVALLLGRQSQSLLHLSMVEAAVTVPAAFSPFYPLPLPKLRTLWLGALDKEPAWLVRVVARDWTIPTLSKFGMGAKTRPRYIWTAAWRTDMLSSPRACHYSDLASFLESWQAPTRPQTLVEVSFSLSGTFSRSIGAYPFLPAWSGIRRIIIQEDFPLQSAPLAMRVNFEGTISEFFTLAYLPRLETVHWVLPAQSGEEELAWSRFAAFVSSFPADS